MKGTVEQFAICNRTDTSHVKRIKIFSILWTLDLCGRVLKVRRQLQYLFANKVSKLINEVTEKLRYVFHFSIRPIDYTVCLETDGVK